MSKIRIVVNMNGGTIESVCTDSEVELDVVFLAEASDIEEEDRFEVPGGEFDGKVIYTHYEGTVLPATDIDPVFAKAEQRLKELH